MMYKWVIFILGAMVLTASATGLEALGDSGGLTGLFREVLHRIEELGAIAPLAFIALYVLCCVLLIPSWILTVGAGILFGVVAGTVYASIGATLGALAACVIGRHVARNWVQRRLTRNTRFSAIDEAVAREGWKIVALMRISPAFPFIILNYLFGLTKIPLIPYTWASWAGMLPATMMYVYIGAMARLGAESDDLSSVRMLLQVAGLIATITVTLYITKLARTALKGHMRESDG